MSVQEYVELGRYPYGECGEYGEYGQGEEASETKRYSEAALDFVSAGNLKLQGVHSLSSGEFQRVALARVLAQLGLPNLLPEGSESCLKILLLDEPLAHLDLYYQYYFLKLLKNLGKHVSVICVMHEINLAAKYADKFLLIKDGEILDFGDKAILTAQNLTTLFGIELTEWAMRP
jgi:iron complex transport system ATP-binding protein